MTCEEFWNHEPEGLEHLGGCPECAARFERQQLVREGLHSLGAQMRWLEAPAYVERRLMADYRSAMRPAEPPHTSGPWWAIGTWAAAIALTAGLAFFVVSGRQPERTQRITRRPTQLASVEVPGAFETADTEIAEGFVPLPNAERIAANEPVNLVRLELPRSTMIALGLAASTDLTEESVEADVMLGADGVPRAVRLLD